MQAVVGSAPREYADGRDQCAAWKHVARDARVVRVACRARGINNRDRARSFDRCIVLVAGRRYKGTYETSDKVRKGDTWLADVFIPKTAYLPRKAVANYSAVASPPNSRSPNDRPWVALRPRPMAEYADLADEDDPPRQRSFLSTCCSTVTDVVARATGCKDPEWLSLKVLPDEMNDDQGVALYVAESDWSRVGNCVFFPCEPRKAAFDFAVMVCVVFSCMVIPCTALALEGTARLGWHGRMLCFGRLSAARTHEGGGSSCLHARPPVSRGSARVPPSQGVRVGRACASPQRVRRRCVCVGPAARFGATVDRPTPVRLSRRSLGGLVARRCADRIAFDDEAGVTVDLFVQVPTRHGTPHSLATAPPPLVPPGHRPRVTPRSSVACTLCLLPGHLLPRSRLQLQHGLPAAGEVDRAPPVDRAQLPARLVLDRCPRLAAAGRAALAHQGRRRGRAQPAVPAPRLPPRTCPPASTHPPTLTTHTPTEQLRRQAHTRGLVC
jgi:hypothetical protein